MAHWAGAPKSAAPRPRPVLATTSIPRSASSQQSRSGGLASGPSAISLFASSPPKRLERSPLRSELRSRGKSLKEKALFWGEDPCIHPHSINVFSVRYGQITSVPYSRNESKPNNINKMAVRVGFEPTEADRNC